MTGALDSANPIAPARKPLRIWPGVAAVTLQWLIRYAVPAVVPDTLFIAVMGGLAGGVLVIIWWLFFSRARWVERLGALALMVAVLVATKPITDISIATGAQGMLFNVLAVPTLSLAFVAWAVATRRLPDRLRYATMVVAVLIGCGVWTLVKTGGFTASFRNDLSWRWTKTPEEKLLEQTRNQPGALPIVRTAAKVEPEVLPPVPVVPKAEEKKVPGPVHVEEKKAAYWPGFRGPHRDGVVPDVKIKTDWTASPPVAIWRRPVGPGWSSFAMRGDQIYTQEQRGPDEIVACYKLSTGEPLWAHPDAARFWESNGGAGPRGTPTLNKGLVFSFGATGIVNALDANSGGVVWSHDAAVETGMKRPQWGFSSSPLVVDDQVIVAVAGQLVSYDRQTGTRRWSGPAHGVSYSSPHLANIQGVPQVLLLSKDGVVSESLTDGALLWEHAWPGYPIVQPALTEEGDVLISVSDSSGTRRLAPSHGATGWTVQERWTSKGLKPYFNDFVVHKGHAYGFDGSILGCIDLADGKRIWKGGRYGNGQLILLPNQDLLLVLSEDGELALVRATPDQFTEVARVPAIEGKTWNHPVLAGDVLLVRNGQEMAAFRLTLADN